MRDFLVTILVVIGVASCVASVIISLISMSVFNFYPIITTGTCCLAWISFLTVAELSNRN